MNTHKSKDISSEIIKAAQSFGKDPITKNTIWESYIIPNGLMDRLVPAIAQLLQDAKIDELKAVYKEIVKNDIAGNVKWYVDDRLAELKGDINEQLDNAYDEVGDRE